MAGNTDETIGAVFTGVIVTSMLWGAACVQTYYFFFSGRKERLYWQFLVALAFLLETTYMALFITDLQSHVITHFGDVPYLEHLVRSLPAQIIVQLGAVAISESIFAYRIFCLLERSIVAAALLFTLILAQLGIGIAYAFQVATAHTYDNLRSLKVVPTIYASLAIVTSAVLAGTLVVLLYRYRFFAQKRMRDPLCPTATNFMHEVLALVLTTGFLPSSFSIAFLATFTAFTQGSHSWLFSFFFAITGCLWLNSMLASFNNRSPSIATFEGVSPSHLHPSTATPVWSSSKLAIDTGTLRRDAEKGNADAFPPWQTPPLQAAALVATSADAVPESAATPEVPEKDQPLTRRLSRALSRTIRKSMDRARPPVPTRPPIRGRGLSVTSPMSPVERRELGPPVSPPPGHPLPLLPFASSMSAIDLHTAAPTPPERLPRAPPPSVLSAGDEHPSNMPANNLLLEDAAPDRLATLPIPSTFPAKNATPELPKPPAAPAPQRQLQVVNHTDAPPIAPTPDLPSHLVRLLPIPGLLKLDTDGPSAKRSGSRSKGSRRRALPRVPPGQS